MKKTIKWLFLAIVFVCVLPAGLLALLCHKLLGSSLCFDLFAHAFSMSPGFIGVAVRACYYKQTLSSSHMDLNMGFGSFISKIGTTIGRGVFINGRNIIGLADIGDGVVVANYVSILSGGRQHNFDDPEVGILEKEGTYNRVTIGRDVFIGDHCVVMADIGEKSIIGSSSLVVKPVPSYSVAVGNPAKVIKNRRQTDSTGS